MLPAADAAWLRMDRPHNLMVVNTVLVLERAPAPGALEAVLLERLVERFPRFRRRVVESGPLRRPAFADTSFRISDHLLAARLPAPGSDADLQRYVGEQISVPLARDVPLWQVHCIEGYEQGAALLVRMHHCLADGVTLARVLLTLTDPIERVAIAASEPGRAVRDIAHDAFELLVHPSRFATVAAAVPRVGATLAKQLVATRGATTVLDGHTGVDKQAAWTSPIPLEPVRVAAHALDATVNDVVLAALSGALRRHIEVREGDVHDLRMIVPFNLRPPTEPLPRELGNRFGLVFVSLPLTVDDPVARVAETHRRMQTIKVSPEPAVSYSVLQGIGRTTADIERHAIGFFASKAVGVVTNVRGPDHALALAGVPVRRVIPLAPVSGDQTIGIAIFTLAGDLVVGVVTDARVVREPASVTALFVEELDTLVRAARARPEALPGWSRWDT
jgi:WS/DGAT/MGAT family acyltransferase